MIAVTTPHIPGHRVARVVGLVHATSVRTRGVGGQLAAALQSLVGGEVRAYVTEVEKARSECLQRLISKAAEMGANAIVGIDFETTELLQGAIVINAWGTAVIVEPEERGAGSLQTPGLTQK